MFKCSIPEFVPDAYFWPYLQDIVLLSLVGLFCYRYFLSPIQHHFSTVQQIESHPFVPLSQTHELEHQLSSPLNYVIEQHSYSLNDIGNTIARLVPMSDELNETYQNIEKKTLLKMNIVNYSSNH